MRYRTDGNVVHLHGYGLVRSFEGASIPPIFEPSRETVFNFCSTLFSWPKQNGIDTASATVLYVFLANLLLPTLSNNTSNNNGTAQEDYWATEVAALSCLMDAVVLAAAGTFG